MVSARPAAQHRAPRPEVAVTSGAPATRVSTLQHNLSAFLHLRQRDTSNGTLLEPVCLDFMRGHEGASQIQNQLILICLSNVNQESLDIYANYRFTGTLPPGARRGL